MKIKVNDEVIVIAGKDKGKKGKVTRTISKSNKVVVEKVNIRTKHIKKTAQEAGQIVKFEAPIDASNVMIIDPKTKKPTRVGYRMLEKRKKERYAKVSDEPLDIKVTTTK